MEGEVNKKEAREILEIMSCADGGCSVCVQELFHEFIDKYGYIDIAQEVYDEIEKDYSFELGKYTWKTTEEQIKEFSIEEYMKTGTFPKYIINRYGKYLSNEKGQPLLDTCIGIGEGDIVTNKEDIEYIGNKTDGYVSKPPAYSSPEYIQKGFAWA